MSTQILSDLKKYGTSAKIQKAAVVFLHGFGGDLQSTWQMFPDFLANDPRLEKWDVYSLGYATGLSFDVSGIWSADPPLISVADLLRAHASISPLKNYGAIALVAHSMGGLVAQRALLDDQDFARRVSHLILFGTPSNGLVKAHWLQFWKRSIENMAADGPFVTDLRARWNRQYAEGPGFKFLTIAGDQDEFVPRTSSVEPFPQTYRRVIAGNHLTIVKPQSADSPGVQHVLDCLVGDAEAKGPLNSAALAVESREFGKAINTLWPGREGLDAAAAVDLALALEGVGRSAEAIEFLEEFLEKSHHTKDTVAKRKMDTDAIGVLAGRLKRRWIAERQEADALRTLELYMKAYELSANKPDEAQAFYHGINVAFMQLVFGGDRQQAATTAQEVLIHCTKAPRELWRLATEGEANLHLGKIDEAVQSYRAALEEKPTPRALRSLYTQAILVCRHRDDAAAEERIHGVLRGGDA